MGSFGSSGSFASCQLCHQARPEMEAVMVPALRCELADVE